MSRDNCRTKQKPDINSTQCGFDWDGASFRVGNAVLFSTNSQYPDCVTVGDAKETNEMAEEMANVRPFSLFLPFSLSLSPPIHPEYVRLSKLPYYGVTISQIQLDLAE